MFIQKAGLTGFAKSGILHKLDIAIRAVTAFSMNVLVPFLRLKLLPDDTGLSVLIVFNGLLEGIGTQVGAVQLVFGEPVQGIGHVLVGNIPGAGKGLAFCLNKLGKAEIAQEVVDRLLACDPSDPLALADLLKSGPS